jgi:chromosome partitioning protein
MLQRVIKQSARVLIPVQPSIFDMWATRQFVKVLLAEKAIRKGNADVALVGMRVDPRTRAAQELEHFFGSLGLPVLTYLRDTQIYVQAAAAGLNIFDLPPSRTERDLEQWAPIINWINAT